MDIGEYASQDHGKTQRRRSVYTFRGDGAFWISDRRGGDVYSVRGLSLIHICSGAGKRYYIDVVLTPAVLVDGKGQLQDMDLSLIHI